MTSSADLAESLEQLRRRHKETPLTRSERQDAARIRNIIVLLSQNGHVITPELICKLLPYTNNCASGSASGIGGQSFVAKVRRIINPVGCEKTSCYHIYACCL